jgi:hypothetical protein
MTWVVAGMALSEMSAMVFVTLSLYLQLRGLGALEQGRPVLVWFLASSPCLKSKTSLPENVLTLILVYGDGHAEEQGAAGALVVRN